jgi:hypothetical protein
MKTTVFVVIAIAIAALCYAAGERAASGRFSDVPDDHWAASAVNQLADEGVLTGYPDSCFKGDRFVTRYELAVALARFAEFIEAGRTPLIKSQKTGSEASDTSLGPSWARDSIDFLTVNKYLPADSPIMIGGSGNATTEDLAQALSSIAGRIVELEVADPGPEDSGVESEGLSRGDP